MEPKEVKHYDEFAREFSLLFRHGMPEDLIALVRQIRAVKQRFLKAQKALVGGDDSPIYLLNIEDNDYEILIARQFAQEGWRITTFYKKNPVGHVGFGDRDSAFQSAIGMNTKEGAPIGSVWYRVKPVP